MDLAGRTAGRNLAAHEPAIPLTGGKVGDSGPDLIVDRGRHTNITLLTPKTDRGREWIAEHVDVQMTLRESLCVDVRYLVQIVDGALEDGLQVRTANEGAGSGADQ